MARKKIQDRLFEVYIRNAEIRRVISDMAARINRDLAGRDVIFLGILNGAFMFASDLFREIKLDSQITFLKLASYAGTSSTGNVKRLIGINEDIYRKTVVILEDIVDTGVTLDNIIKQLKGYEPAEIKVATMLFKPSSYTKDLQLDYVGIEIPNDFVLGYGLDYQGYGRNLSDLYREVSH